MLVSADLVGIFGHCLAFLAILYGHRFAIVRAEAKFGICSAYLSRSAEIGEGGIGLCVWFVGRTNLQLFTHETLSQNYGVRYVSD